MTPLPEPGTTVHLLGTLITYRATAAQTDGLFALADVRTAPGAITPPHVQSDDAESFYVLEGSYEIMLDGETREYGPGSFVHVPKGRPHGFRNAGTTPARMLIINMPGGIHERFYAEAGDPVADPTSFPPPAAPDIPRLMTACAHAGITMLGG